MLVSPSILAMVVLLMVSFTVTAAKNYNFVAFSVSYSKNFNPASDAKIMFDRELYNDDNHFDKKTGDFTAPVDGLYKFSFGAGGNNPGTVFNTLRTGNPETAQFRIYDSNSKHGYASATVMLKLNKGELASVWAHKDSSVHNSQVSGEPSSTFFTGRLMESFESC